MRVEAAFAIFWKSILAKDPKLAQYGKSLKAALNDAFAAGYKAGLTDHQIQIEAHKAN